MSKENRFAYHILYKIVRFDGKYYIGIHSTNNIEDGYLGSGLRIARSIRKYGKEAHFKQVLEMCSSREELKRQEIELVNDELLQDEMCLNIVRGGTGGNIGGGGFFSEAHRRNFHRGGGIATSIKRKNDIEFKSDLNSKISKSLHEFHKSHPGFNQKAAKIATKSAWSEESRKQRKATNDLRGFGKGSKNPRFGTVLVNDGIKNISIKKEFLDEYLTNGFVKGMLKRK
jgi:hypothetical protein